MDNEASIQLEIIIRQLDQLLKIVGGKKKEAKDMNGWLDSATIKAALNISDSTLYRLRKNKEIDFIFIGGRRYYQLSPSNNRKNKSL